MTDASAYIDQMSQFDARRDCKSERNDQGLTASLRLCRGNLFFKPINEQPTDGVRRMILNETSGPLVSIEVFRVVFVDIRNLIDDDGKFERVNELTDESAVAIQSVSFEDSSGGGDRFVGARFFDKA